MDALKHNNHIFLCPWVPLDTQLTIPWKHYPAPQECHPDRNPPYVRYYKLTTNMVSSPAMSWLVASQRCREKQRESVSSFVIDTNCTKIIHPFRRKTDDTNNITKVLVGGSIGGPLFGYHNHIWSIITNSLVFNGGTPLLINRQNSSEELAPKNSYPWHPH